MLALQELGKRLSELPEESLRGMALPRELEDALLLAKTMKSREARRRHLQYIGALMRRVDSEPIQQAYEDLFHFKGREIRAFQEAERWRDELMNGNDSVIDLIADRFPGIDRQEISSLVNSARTEQATGGKRYYRELFRYLREISGDPGGASSK